MNSNNNLFQPWLEEFEKRLTANSLIIDFSREVVRQRKQNEPLELSKSFINSLCIDIQNQYIYGRVIHFKTKTAKELFLSELLMRAKVKNGELRSIEKDELIRIFSNTSILLPELTPEDFKLVVGYLHIFQKYFFKMMETFIQSVRIDIAETELHKPEPAQKNSENNNHVLPSYKTGTAFKSALSEQTVALLTMLMVENDVFRPIEKNKIHISTAISWLTKYHFKNINDAISIDKTQINVSSPQLKELAKILNNMIHQIIELSIVVDPSRPISHPEMR